MMNNEQHIPVASAAPDEAFQARVKPWMMECFGAEIAADSAERNHRFLEESLELVQASGCTASEAHQLVDYVFSRPVGERAQEVGGVMVTLAALCLAQGLDMHAAGETELTRIWTKVEAIRAKQAAKPKHSPLPAAAPQVAVAERAAVVYPPDGTVSPFTVINLGHGLVKMGDSLHDGRLPAIWFGKDGLGMGVAEEMNRAAKEGETLAVVTFSNVDGLDVLAEVVQRIRSVAFPTAPVQPQEPVADASADIFDLIREWAHLPEGQRSDAASNIIGCLNRSYSAGVSDGKELGRLSTQAQPVAVPDSPTLILPSDEQIYAHYQKLHLPHSPVIWTAALGTVRAVLNAQAKAAAFAPPAAAKDVCAEMRALCSACGGTGDVHRADGEWLGECTCIHALAQRQAIQAEGKHPAPCARSCEAPAYQNQLRERDARISELGALLARRRIPLSPETQQAIADARADDQTVALTSGGLVFMNDGAEPDSGELDCPACGGSGHAGDATAGSVP